MSKTYSDTKSIPREVAEPAATYAVQDSLRPAKKDLSPKKNTLHNTMSVDAYFDELISLVHKDYASL